MKDEQYREIKHNYELNNIPSNLKEMTVTCEKGNVFE
jgi:hypothetical protein